MTTSRATPLPFLPHRSAPASIVFEDELACAFLPYEAPRKVSSPTPPFTPQARRRWRWGPPGGGTAYGGGVRSPEIHRNVQPSVLQAPGTKSWHDCSALVGELRASTERLGCSASRAPDGRTPVTLGCSRTWPSRDLYRHHIPSVVKVPLWVPQRLPRLGTAPRIGGAHRKRVTPPGEGRGERPLIPRVRGARCRDARWLPGPAIHGDLDGGNRRFPRVGDAAQDGRSSR